MLLGLGLKVKSKGGGYESSVRNSSSLAYYPGILKGSLVLTSWGPKMRVQKVFSPHSRTTTG